MKGEKKAVLKAAITWYDLQVEYHMALKSLPEEGSDPELQLKIIKLHDDAEDAETTLLNAVLELKRAGYDR